MFHHYNSESLAEKVMAVPIQLCIDLYFMTLHQHFRSLSIYFAFINIISFRLSNKTGYGCAF